jgi:hypothetical protein
MVETYGLTRILREIVTRHKLAGDASVHTSPAMVCSLNDGILETTGVFEVQVELAILGVVRLHGVGANVCLERILNDSQT